jgi:hypothetical protein
MPVRGTLKKYTLHSTTTAEHRQPDNQQERRLEESLAVNQCEKTENQAEQNKSHAVAGIEVHPTPPHRICNPRVQGDFGAAAFTTAGLAWALFLEPKLPAGTRPSSAPSLVEGPWDDTI